MPPKDKNSMKQLQSEGHPPIMLPECANTFGVLTTRLEQVAIVQDRIAKKIWGNGVIGMDNLISDNQRQIAALASLVATLVASKDEEVVILKNEKKEREEELKLTIVRREETTQAAKAETKKFWYSIAGALIVAIGTAGIAIWQAFQTQKLLLSLVPGG